MAWDWYLNIEPISFDIALSHIEQMTETNYGEGFLDIEGKERIPDEKAFMNNFNNGFISVVMMSCYVEACLNVILREYCQYSPDGEVIRGKEEDKLSHIFQEEKESLRKIKGSHHWREYNRMKNVRHELIHYKNNNAAVMASWPPFDSWQIGNELIAEFFTRENMDKLSRSVHWVVCEILRALGLEINPSPILFGADGRCGTGSYICTMEEAALIRKCEL